MRHDQSSKNLILDHPRLNASPGLGSIMSARSANEMERGGLDRCDWSGRALRRSVNHGNVRGMIDWERVTGFDWDEGDARKGVAKHSVSRGEAEQAFSTSLSCCCPTIDEDKGKCVSMHWARQTTDSPCTSPLHCALPAPSFG